MRNQGIAGPTGNFQDLDSIRPIVQCFHLYKRYVRGQNIFHDASLQIERGDFVFLTGPSGSGKTTLLKMMMRLEPTTEGHILVDGHNLGRLRRRDLLQLRRRTGMVFQDFKLIPSRTVGSNVALPLEVIGKPGSFIRKKVNSVLRFVGMETKAKVPCKQLSGGEQQRVALARAVANDPLLLLADEPTGNLDECASRLVMELFQRIHVRGTTVIVATHDQELPNQIAEARIIKIHERQFIEVRYEQGDVYVCSSEARLS